METPLQPAPEAPDGGSSHAPSDVTSEHAAAALDMAVPPAAGHSLAETTSHKTMIDGAMREQYRMDRETVERLVKENVRLERRVHKLTEQVLELEDRVVNLEDDLETATAQNKDLVNQINTGAGGAMTAQNGLLAKEDHDLQLRTLQLRLTRLARDEREKDLRLDDLQQQLTETRSYVTSLEDHVGEKQVRDIKLKHDRLKNKEDYYKTHEKTNVVSHTDVSQKSKVCAVS